MKYLAFLNSLNFTDKFLFTIGAVTEKIVKKQERYQSLKYYKKFLSNLNTLGFRYTLKGGCLDLQKDTTTILLRKNSTDFEVFEQVFIKNEYQPVLDYFKDNNVSISTAIDAGSNIGLTSLKILNSFPEVRIACLEPDPENFKQLSHNLDQFSHNVSLLPKALWHQEEDLFLDFSFRGGRDWSRSVSNNPSSSQVPVKAITVKRIMEEFDFKTIDLLKIDIEGSEVKIFDQNNDLSFLNNVKVIAIEIHDEFDCRDQIYTILKARGFILLNSGELSIAINSNYIDGGLR